MSSLHSAEIDVWRTLWSEIKTKVTKHLWRKEWAAWYFFNSPTVPSCGWRWVFSFKKNKPNQKKKEFWSFKPFLTLRINQRPNYSLSAGTCCDSSPGPSQLGHWLSCQGRRGSDDMMWSAVTPCGNVSLLVLDAPSSSFGPCVSLHLIRYDKLPGSPLMQRSQATLLTRYRPLVQRWPLGRGWCAPLSSFDLSSSL